ncbi:MAG: phosphatase PAP2 family protein [Thermoleophilia bacterium]
MSATPSGRRTRNASPARRRLAFMGGEIGIWVALYGVYLAVRGLTIGGREEAIANARGVIGLEHSLGVFREMDVQSALEPLRGALSAYYMAGFAPVIAATLVVLAVRDRTAYRELRTALLVSIAIATVVFVAFPAAPPRLVPELGILDTVGLTGHDNGSFAGIRFNPYAAVPSMHVGRSLLVGIAGYRAARTRWVKALFAAHPAVMVLTVTATGNHYFFDAATGTVVALAGLLITRRGRTLVSAIIKSRRKTAGVGEPVPVG